MAPTFIRGDMSLSVEGVRLGRLVSSIKEPLRDFYDDPSAELAPVEILYRNREDTGGSDKGESSFLKLTSLASLAFSKQSRRHSRVFTESMKKYSFNNWTQYFRTITQHPGTWEWIEKAVREGRRKQICLIVGYTTVSDAEVTTFADKSISANVSLHAPLLQVGLIPGGEAIPLDAVVAGAGARAHRDVGIESRFTASGEHVVALQYQKVRISSIDRRDAKLTGSQEAYTSIHGRRGEEDTETDNVMVAKINEYEERYDFEGEGDEDYESGEEDDDEDDEIDKGWTEVLDKKSYYYL